MAYEVEMKAWVDDWSTTEAYLRRTSSFRRSFRKQDRYFYVGPDDEAHERRFRVRVDDDRTSVTFKDRLSQEDAEINVEREFTVDDVDAFLELMRRAGGREAYAKLKEGLHFERDGLTVELVHVAGLGDFLEVEYVHAEADEDAHAAAVSLIRSFLSDAGIPPGRVERRPYMELLRDQRRDR